MIIQCEKCKTRFKLDDSRISSSGVRVRCSRCSHTFIVQRDEPEEESDFESILQGLGGSEPTGDDEATVPEAGEFATEKPAEVPASPQVGTFVGDEPSVDESLTESGSSHDLSWAADTQQSPHSPVEPQKQCEEEVPVPEQTGIEESSFSDLLNKGVGLPHFQRSPDLGSSEKVPSANNDEAGSGLSSHFDNSPVQNKLQVDDNVDDIASANRSDANGGPLEAPLSEALGKPLSSREHVWPVADSKDEEGLDEDLSPLSISSRRKGSPIFSILTGTLLVLLLAGAGFYLFSVKGDRLSEMIPDSVNALFGFGKNAERLVEIRSLEGVFVKNREAGELFVMTGDVFNVSSKPLTTIQVRGKIYGPKGEVLMQQTVFCGNVLTGDQLALQPYSSMVKVMGNQFGETLANFQVQPGKGIPFVIVFKDVQRGAKGFGAVVVSPVGMNVR